MARNNPGTSIIAAAARWGRTITYSFHPVPSHYDDFEHSVGRALFDYHRPIRQEVGGALSVFDSLPNCELIPTFGARAITSGGTLAAADFARLSGEFLAAIAEAAKPDAVYLALHGAMAAEQEGDLLEESRKILGPEIPIVVSLDLHGILTDRMLEHGDAVVVYHTYPHVDFFETGERAARVVDRILKGARPVTARVTIPALVRGDELITATGSFGECIRLAQEVERQPRGLSAGMFVGNPFTDVPDLRSNSLVVMDGDEAEAKRQAMAAGVGGTIRTEVGGALDPRRFQPLFLEAQVRLLSDGNFHRESFGCPWYSGPTAVLQCGSITLVVGSRPVSLFDRAFFWAHGQNPRRFDLLVVKSPHCEPHMFADWCARLINVDAPGATSANVRSLGHVTCGRPIFPLDADVTLAPRADVFRRS